LTRKRGLYQNPPPEWARRAPKKERKGGREEENDGVPKQPEKRKAAPGSQTSGGLDLDKGDKPSNEKGGKGMK